MENFTINRDLCEVEFANKNLETIDVDVMEFVWFKIRENYENPIATLNIGFCEIKRKIGRYNKKALIESIQRLDGASIVTNQKSPKPSQQFNFSFALSENMKYFSVGLQLEIFQLFNKPKSYSKYNQGNVYQFDEKYSKLLYKFLIGYKNLAGNEIFIRSDTLMKIMNVHSEEPISKIQYNIFKSSITKINKRTDLDVSLDKLGEVYVGGDVHIEYAVTVNEWKGDVNDKNTKGASGIKIRIDKWIEDVKSQCEYDPRQKGVPMVVIKNPESHLPTFIDDEYRITNSCDLITKTPTQTLKRINKWIKAKVMDCETEMMPGYSKKFW
ncbi:RepB family plasmid replication initiator protein, partial [Aeromonas veronii]|uniref:RepB family plasmid replication initiator protein n=1 Tax=Aeromonas veronii TaxID=654 RepID=UPI003D233BC1